MKTFSGRFFHFVRLTWPGHLISSSDKDLENARNLISTFRSNPRLFPSNSYEALWNAKYTLDATIHPDTKEKFLLPFRMAAFVPTNLLVIAGLLLPNPSVKSIVFWQWVNQSLNVGVNWANAKY